MPRDIYLAFASVFAHRSDNAVVANRNVGLDELAADQIEDPPAFQHHVGLSKPLPLLDGPLEKGNGVAHAVSSGGLSAKSWAIVSGLPRAFKQAVDRRLASSAQKRSRFDVAVELSSRRATLAPILSIQSHVVYGHVGNSAAVFPLQRLGREVWPLLTVQFSSHLGYAGWRGRAFDAAMIDDCMSGLEAIGVLPLCAGLLTGFLGKPEIGEAALRALDRIHAANGAAAYACDAVIGDVGPGLRGGGRRRILP